MEFNKTDDELKMMTDDELFNYLDRKAEYLKQHVKPLSPYHVKQYSHISAAISNQTDCSEKVFENVSYDGLKKIIEKNGRKYKKLF